MILLPAIDLRGGRVVRLLRGADEERTEYDVAPREALERYLEAGAEWVHVVDLDAAFGEAPQRGLVAELVEAAKDRGVSLQLGGGLRDRESVEWAFGVGCSRVVSTSMMVRDWELFEELTRAHPRAMVPALDCFRGELRTSGWTRDAGLDLDDLCARLRQLPIGPVLVTDIDRDGAMTGPNLELAQRLAQACGVEALLSGGVRSVEDLARAREAPRIAGAIVGRALYDGTLDLDQALSACRPAQRSQTRLACRIIPCLDVAAGRVVKGVNFENLTDQGDPAETALRYYEQGADEIVFLDITAAPERRDTDLDWVRRTAEQVFIPLTVGGGVRGIEDGRRLLLAGADKVAVNTAAVDRPALLRELAERFGSQCVVISIDARRTADRIEWEVVTHGGRTGTGLDVLEWVERAVELGAGEVLLTSIDADGTQHGYDLELLRAVTARVSVPVIASGGAGVPEHLADALQAGASAVLAASIFHQSTHTVGEVKSILAGRFPMRPVLEVKEGFS